MMFPYASSVHKIDGTGFGNRDHLLDPSGKTAFADSFESGLFRIFYYQGSAGTVDFTLWKLRRTLL